MRARSAFRGLAADNIAVVAPVGLFLGRCANFINGELYGRATTIPWAMQFPKEALDLPEVGARLLAAVHATQPEAGNLERVIEDARHDPALQSVLHQVLTPRHPSQLYEALLEGAFLFGCLWFLRLRTKQPRGMLAGLRSLAFVRIVLMFPRTGRAVRPPSRAGKRSPNFCIVNHFVVYAKTGIRRSNRLGDSGRPDATLDAAAASPGSVRAEC
jgi:prolipoprotein diacylglyceryltransferase